MSIFDKNAIQSPPDPQIYFERLCEEEFGINFTEHSIYEYQGAIGQRISYIWNLVRKSYPGKMMKLEKYNFGHMRIKQIDMFDLPDDYWDNPDYDWVL